MHFSFHGGRSGAGVMRILTFFSRILTCFENFICRIIQGIPTRRREENCYLPQRMLTCCTELLYLSENSGRAASGGALDPQPPQPARAHTDKYHEKTCFALIFVGFRVFPILFQGGSTRTLCECGDFREREGCQTGPFGVLCQFWHDFHEREKTSG